MDVVFFGSGAFGLPTLRVLCEVHCVRAVVTQPDRPAGRGGKVTPTPIGRFAQESMQGTPLLKPERVSADDVREVIRDFRVDAWVVIAFGQKLSEELLDGVFAVNLHASLLPRWRGAAPINAAILVGDTETGNSVITLADRMDAGLVLGQSRRPIGERDTAGRLHDALASDGPGLVLDVLEQHEQGRVHEVVQDETLVTLAPKLSKRDGWVDFSDAAAVCRSRINGLSPWPGVTVRFRAEPLKLLGSERVSRESEEDSVSRADPGAVRSEIPGEIPGEVPGTIVDVDDGIVVCGEGAIRLLEVQPPGKRAMSWEAFARGRRVMRGERIEGNRPE